MASRLGIGAGIGIPFRNIASGGGKPYLSPEVKEALKAVVIAYGKTNNDSDRAVVKNLVDASNPFIISNAAYKLNSGYGLYGMDFLDWKSNSDMNFTSTKLTSTKPNLSGGWLTFRNVSGLIPETKIKVSGAPREFVFIGNNNGTDDKFSVTINNGVYTIPEFTLSSASGFYINNNSGDWSNLVIEQIPQFEGAFVTDGVDDLITSTKTVQEMLGGSNEITIVSMVHQVKDTTNNVSFTNYIRGSINGYFRNIVNNYGKTGIYGYTSSDLRSLSVINNILGDKNDYTSNGDNRDTIINGNFSVQGYSYNNSNNTGDFSSVAWYWTVIANKVLTTDQINQVIAYFNLDRTLKPDILCNTIKQGITNENHAEFGDKLIDFSGNGRDIQLNNIAWKGDSGIGKYEVDFTTWTRGHFTDEVNFTPSKIEVTGILTTSSILINNNSTPIYKVDIYNPNKSVTVYFQCNNGTDITRISLVDGINELPSGDNSIFVTSDRLNSKGITITQIPSHAGALYLDGVNDFGKVTGMPIYKDYTVITDREIFANIGAISSKNNPGAFVELAGDSVYSFDQATSGLNFISTRSISYLSKYSYCGQSITAGAAEDGTDMWLGTIRDNDTRFFNGAIYSLMSFPYSMSEFLIERQLKKHKLGTLYPDMVEFRPIVNSNVEWNTIEIWQADKSLYRPANGTNETGTYLQKDSTIGIYVKPKGVDEVTKIVVNGTEYTNLKINSNGFYYVTLPITTSPQKIDITIDEYIRYEDIDFTSAYPFVPIIEGYTWGDKLKVGDKVTYKVWSNMLTDLYSRRGEMKLNGENILSNSSITVEKSMKFEMNKVYLKSNEPKCILSPSRLRIPNSSYKILGYIPDISGHGNHGKINNSAYAEGSGVNADGSYQLDGVDDFVIIPTLSKSGKQVLMKINWNTEYYNRFIVDFRKVEGDTNYIINDFNALSNSLAYQNANKTYIDGILNNSIKTLELKGVTHNIVSQFIKANSSPYIGARTGNGDNMTMSLYDFMLFDEISTDEEILTLNEYVGIEGNTDDLFTENN